MKTTISINGTDFYINGQPTYNGRYYQGRRVEGLLLNSRMVQAIFDDENPETAIHWQYPDTKKWDADRNTDEFCAALPLYREHGLLAVTVGLQGGGPIYSPEIYKHYLNSAFAWDGSLKPAYFERLQRVFAAAGVSELLTPCTTAEYPTPARRPAWSVLDTDRAAGLLGGPLPHWEHAVDRFVDELRRE